jgi:hypothetical protein
VALSKAADALDQAVKRASEPAVASVLVEVAQTWLGIAHTARPPFGVAPRMAAPRRAKHVSGLP